MSIEHPIKTGARRTGTSLPGNSNDEIHELRQLLARQKLTSAEANHRILNGLQLAVAFLRLEEMRLDDDAARRVLTKAVSRLEAVAYFHRHINKRGNDAVLNLAAYLDDIVPQIEKITGVRCTLDRDPVFVAGRLASDIGVLVNEMVTNAAKHAYGDRSDGNVQISCVRDGADGLTLSVRDHGPGFRPDGDDKGKSLGMLVIHTLVKQHGGRFEVVNDGGAEMRVFLPSAIVSTSADQPL
jgi:two-component sensor histidine kinase